MDKGEVTALPLLDLSAPFDTIDHASFTNRLLDCYWISGQAQIWFSYFQKHTEINTKSWDIFLDRLI